MNNPLVFIDPDGLEGLIIGSYNDLTDEQKRLFQTYVNKNYADQIGDMKPEDFAARLWNESALVANIEGGDASVVGGNILTQSQLTTFLGVTNMLESRGVIGEVASITSINGDILKHEFRLIGELKNGTDSVKAIDKAFSHDIAGKGHSPYDISKREQGMFGQPNGQVSRIPKGTGVDVDVDYRALYRIFAHPTRENSDIRADDGNTSHYRRNVERYGPIRALSPVNPTFIKQEK